LELAEHAVPSLHYLDPGDRDAFELLDVYLRGCLEAWWNQEGKLSARSIVLFDECRRTLTQKVTLLDGEALCYFCLCQQLVRCLLREMNVEQFYHLAVQEWAADPDLGPFF
jgi:hypothetical protein